jgi:hypothetical protein
MSSVGSGGKKSLPTCAPKAAVSEHSKTLHYQNGTHEHADEDEVVNDALQVVTKGRQRGVILLGSLGASLARRRRRPELGV